MEGPTDISRLNTVRNLLAGLTTAAICGAGAALLMPRQGTLNTESQVESVPLASESSQSSEATEDVVYLGQLPGRLRSLSAAETSRAVFRPAGLSQEAQEPVAAAEASAGAADQPIETQLFDPGLTEPAQDAAAVQATDEAVVQFEISEQQQSGTAEVLEVGREATVHLQQSPATVNIPVNVTVNNGELLGQLESLKQQVEQLTRRLEASEAALAEARAAALASKTSVAAVPQVKAGAAAGNQAAKAAPAVRPPRPRIQRPAVPAGPVQIDYFPASGVADDKIQPPPIPESVPGSPPPAVPEFTEPQAAVSEGEVPDSAVPLINDAPVLPELVPDSAGSGIVTGGAVEPSVPAKSTEPVSAEPVPAEPVQPQSGLPRSSGVAAAVVAVSSQVSAPVAAAAPVPAPRPAPVPGVPVRTVSGARTTTPHEAPELQYENWRDPGVPRQAPAWGGTVSRAPENSPSLVKRAVTNMREGVEETFDRLPTPDLRAPEWMRSMFRKTTKSVGRSGGAVTAPAPAPVTRGVVVRPASHMQPGPPRQGSVGASAVKPAQRTGVR